MKCCYCNQCEYVYLDNRSPEPDAPDFEPQLLRDLGIDELPECPSITGKGIVRACSGCGDPLLLPVMTLEKLHHLAAIMPVPVPSPL